MTDSGRAPRQYADWFTVLRGEIAEAGTVSLLVASPHHHFHACLMTKHHLAMMTYSQKEGPCRRSPRCRAPKS